MEISGNIYSQPVNFYNKNTGNSVNTVIESENRLYGENFLVSEYNTDKITKPPKKAEKKRRKNKRLNTFDTDYLPDEIDENKEEVVETKENFFIDEKTNFRENIIKRAISNIISETPLINYFVLKQKKNKIQKTVEKLNDITQNVDELITTAVPFGENNTIYNDLAKNLTNAAEILGKAQKNLK